VDALIQQHPTAAVIFTLMLIFGSGCLDHWVGSRDMACVTWFGGLVSLSFWIFSFVGVTLFALVLAPIVLATGLVALIGYYRHWEWDSSL
jgi:hypothetical protein